SNTDWCGNLMFTTAAFGRTHSYGMITTCPLETGGVRVDVTVFARRSAGRLGRALADPLRLGARRFFIMQFLRPDAALLDGLRYQPRGLLECDRHLADYWQWLAALAGRTAGTQAS